MNSFHCKFEARVERTFARMRTWNILRDYRLKGDSVHSVVLVTASLLAPIFAGCTEIGGALGCERSVMG